MATPPRPPDDVVHVCGLNRDHDTLPMGTLATIEAHWLDGSPVRDLASAPVRLFDARYEEHTNNRNPQAAVPGTLVSLPVDALDIGAAVSNHLTMADPPFATVTLRTSPCPKTVATPPDMQNEKLISLLAIFAASLVRSSNRRGLRQLGVRATLLEVMEVESDRWMLIREMLDGMHRLGTFATLNYTSSDFNALWLLPSSRRLLSQPTIPALLEKEGTVVFYLVLCRKGSKQALYVGSTPGVDLARCTAEHHAAAFPQDDVEKLVPVGAHHAFARAFVKGGGSMRVVPITYLAAALPGGSGYSMREPEGRARWAHQLLTMMFESYHESLLGPWLPPPPSDNANPAVTPWGLIRRLSSRAWTKPFASAITRLVKTVRFRGFEKEKATLGCNWSSPFLDCLSPVAAATTMPATRFWTRTTVPDAFGDDIMYRFRMAEGVQPVFPPECTTFTLRINAGTTSNSSEHDPERVNLFSFPPLILDKKDFPGLDSGTPVHIIVEIMAGRGRDGDRLPRHATPWLPVPAVGPFDAYADAAALAIMVEWWCTRERSWMVRPITPQEWEREDLYGLLMENHGDDLADRHRRRSRRISRRVTDEDHWLYDEDGDGDRWETRHMTPQWVDAMRLIAGLMRWTYTYNTAQWEKWAKVLDPNWPLGEQNERVVAVEWDVFNQALSMTEVETTWQPVPRLLTVDDNAARLAAMYDPEGMRMAIGPVPGEEFYQRLEDIPGEVIGPRVFCDMCSLSPGLTRHLCEPASYRDRDMAGIVTCNPCARLRRPCTWSTFLADWESAVSSCLDDVFPHLAFPMMPVVYPVAKAPEVEAEAEYHKTVGEVVTDGGDTGPRWVSSGDEWDISLSGGGRVPVNADRAVSDLDASLAGVNLSGAAGPSALRWPVRGQGRSMSA